MASPEHIGQQLHPYVTPYISGGIGHREGDPHKSVVGFLPTETVAKFREHHAGDDWHGEQSRRKVEAIADDIRSGVGIHEPLVIDYNHKEGWGFLGEGNHRLRAAEVTNTPVVPVRIYGRSTITPDRRPRIGQKMRPKGDFGSGDPRYSPPDIHPDHFEWD